MISTSIFNDNFDPNWNGDVCLKCRKPINELSSYYDKCDECALKLGLELNEKVN